jgi:hypothetical protein
MNAAQLFAAATPRERRDAFQREAEEQLETARAIAGQYPPKVATWSGPGSTSRRPSAPFRNSKRRSG